jgi:hypothetical protein
VETSLLLVETEALVEALVHATVVLPQAHQGKVLLAEVQTLEWGRETLLVEAEVRERLEATLQVLGLLATVETDLPTYFVQAQTKLVLEAGEAERFLQRERAEREAVETEAL